MTTNLLSARKRLRSFASSSRAKISQSFFKTGKGQYGAGDKFIGVTVPATRQVAKEFKNLSLSDLKSLLGSKIHEERLLALIILGDRFQTENETNRKKIYRFYLSNRKHVNNWDLVDTSAAKILGCYLMNQPRTILYKLAASEVLWDRRIAVVASFAFIRNGDFEDISKLAIKLMGDQHDLMHKAIGWMLREVGKKDPKVHDQFLRQHYSKMPRTMLRYAIERLPEKRRKAFLCGKV